MDVITRINLKVATRLIRTGYGNKLECGNQVTDGGYIGKSSVLVSIPIMRYQNTQNEFKVVNFLLLQGRRVENGYSPVRPIWSMIHVYEDNNIDIKS